MLSTTHLPILKYVLDYLPSNNRRNIFEYGMGIYSTTLFSNYAEKLISVEMQNEEFYNQLLEYNFKSNVNLYCMIGKEDAIFLFKNLDIKFDIVFVDGHSENRWKCINEAFGKCDIIIAHDTETDSYNWNNVILPNDYKWLDIKILNPWTSVITNNKNLISSLCKKFNATLR